MTVQQKDEYSESLIISTTYERLHHGIYLERMNVILKSNEKTEDLPEIIDNLLVLNRKEIHSPVFKARQIVIEELQDRLESLYEEDY